METCDSILVVCSSGGLRGLCLSGGFDQSLVGLLPMGVMASGDRFVGIGHLRVVVFISGLPTQDQISVDSLDGNWVYFLFSVYHLRFILSVLGHRWKPGCAGCDIHRCFVVICLVL